MNKSEQDLVNVVANIAFINGSKQIDVLLPPNLRPSLPQTIRNKFQLIQVQEEGWKTKMILQVHDELVFDVPRAELEQVQAVVREAMEHAVQLEVPLVVDMATGESWLEAHG